MSALAGSVQVTDGWAEVTFGAQPFRFLLGAPLYLFSSQLQPLASAVSVSQDTLFLPFQFVAESCPPILAIATGTIGAGPA